MYVHSQSPAYSSEGTSKVQPSDTCSVSPFTAPGSKDQRMEPERLTLKFITKESTQIFFEKNNGGGTAQSISKYTAMPHRLKPRRAATERRPQVQENRRFQSQQPSVGEHGT